MRCVQIGCWVRCLCRFELKSRYALAFLFVIRWCASSLAADSQRPNVLWICADDQAAYVCGGYGNRLVHTPHIDALAARGVRFDRAFCNSPVCTASRQSFLTGRYPRTIGVTQLATALPESEITLAELLRDAGYDTAAIGKMHFNSELKHGFDSRSPRLYGLTVGPVGPVTVMLVSRLTATSAQLVVVAGAKTVT